MPSLALPKKDQSPAAHSINKEICKRALGESAVAVSPTSQWAASPRHIRNLSPPVSPCYQCRVFLVWLQMSLIIKHRLSIHVESSLL